MTGSIVQGHERRAFILVPSDRSGGAERVQKIVALDLLARGWQVDIACLSEGIRAVFAPLASERCTVTMLSRTRELHGVAGMFRLAFGTLRKRNYDLYFSSHTHCNAFLSFLRLMRLIRTDRLVARESTVVGRRFKGFTRLFYKTCYLFYGAIDMVVCQTEEMRRLLPAFAPLLDSKRLVTVPNPAPRANVERRDAPLRDPIELVAVGRLIPEKGVSVLLESVRRLHATGQRVRLRVYGDGPLRAELEGLASSLGLESVVRFEGVTTEALARMSDADVCVVSSITEGFPNTLLEMMQANVRVVSTLCADGIDAIDGLVTCPVADAQALAEAIQAVIAGPTEGRARLFDEELAKRDPRAFVDRLLHGPAKGGVLDLKESLDRP
ncbi:glycosyltransferase [Bacillus sp. NP157]|nr:glycosyltransferase [Bacillus sp. NP157]